MFNHRSLASIALATCFFPACAHDQQPRPVTRADVGDVHVVETIRSCAVNRSADEWVPTTPDDVTLKVDLMVSNASGKATTLYPDRLRLSDTKIEREAAPSPSFDALSLAPGETRQIAVEFHGSGDFSCSDPFHLDIGGAVGAAGRSL